MEVFEQSPALHTSVVQELLSSQFTPAHSLLQFEIGVLEQLVAAAQASVVQSLLSLQLIEVFEHCPLAQASVVQRLLSSQSMPEQRSMQFGIAEFTHPVEALHSSVVQSALSLQSMAECEQPDVALQGSVVQAFASSQFIEV